MSARRSIRPIQLGRAPGLRLAWPRLTPTSREVVLFDAWRGLYSDNPRAISEEIQRRELPLELVWVLEEGAAGPPGVKRVTPGSRQHLTALGRAGYLVTNNNMPGKYFRKKRSQRYLQTWHGTPLKRIAFDIENPAFDDSERYLDDLRRDVDSWDLLISPNSFSTEVLRRAFRYRGPIIESGYPRNDALSSPDRDRVRAETRGRLGLPDDQVAILYAPTWRDDSTFTTPLELERMMDALSSRHTMLLRAHKLVAETVAAQNHPRIIDVSGLPDIRELYLAADVLVTDYSSAMFDYAVTRKPMLFFTYDLETYRDRLRGFYFDFEADAPGPLLTSTEQVVESLGDLDGVLARYRPAYAAFVERFCHLDDGHAAARAVDALFGERRWNS